jgi:hypothetical protein
VPDPAGRGPQPVVFVVVAQQHLGHGQADQFGVGDLGGPTGPTALVTRSCRNDAVGQLHVECDEKSVQVGDHGRPHGSKVCRHADLGTLRHSGTPCNYQHPVSASCRDGPCGRGARRAAEARPSRLRPRHRGSTRKPRRDVTARAARLPVSVWMRSWTS